LGLGEPRPGRGRGRGRREEGELGVRLREAMTGVVVIEKRS